MPSWRSPAASSLLPPDVPPALPLNLQPSDSPWRISPRVADVAPGIIGLNLNDIPADRCAVSAMRSEDGRLELFAIGPDDGIYHRATARTVRPTTGPETWTGWTRLGGSAGSGPAVARDPLGRLVVVVMAADGSYKFISQRPSATHAANFTAWTSLGGRFRSRPAVVRDSEGFLHVFGRDVNDTLLHRSQRPHADGPRTKVVWGGWVNVGAPITSRPSAMVDHESMINVYARGQDRQLWRLRQVSVLAEKSLVRWAEWEPLGGVLASTPTLAPSIGSSWLSLVAARSADKALWLLPQQANGESGVAWGQWATLGGVFASGPALVGGDDGTVAVAGRGVDEHLWLRRRTLAKPKPDASPEPVVATTAAAELCPAAPPSAKEPCKQIGLSCGYNEVCCPATTPAAGFCTNTTAVFCRPAIGGNESAVEVLSPAWGEGRWDVGVTSNPHCDRPNPGPSPLPATTPPLSAPLAGAAAAPSPPCGGAFLTAGPEAVRSGVKETGAPPCGERWEWSEWTDLGGVTTTTPAVERADDGLLRLFVRGGDGAINMRAEVRTGEGETGWAPWTSLGAPLGETKTWAC